MRKRKDRVVSRFRVARKVHATKWEMGGGREERVKELESDSASLPNGAKTIDRPARDGTNIRRQHSEGIGDTLTGPVLHRRSMREAPERLRHARAGQHGLQLRRR
eukprot:1313550-Pleurochrysis_carterae.AAC.2